MRSANELTDEQIEEYESLARAFWDWAEDMARNSAYFEFAGLTLRRRGTFDTSLDPFVILETLKR